MKLTELMNLLQQKLELSDVQYSKILRTDVTTISKARSETTELPLHSKFILLEVMGFNENFASPMALLTKASKEKVAQAFNEGIFDKTQESIVEDLRHDLIAESID